MRTLVLVVALAGCGSSGDTCGPGTHAEGGQCLVGATGGSYEVRIAATSLPADGYSAVPVLALGTRADGTPAADAVVLSLTAAGAGTLKPAMLTLTPLGATSYFVPCDAATSGSCLGMFQVTLALASAPSTVVARSWPVTLVQPTGVGTPAPCQGGGNVVFFDGDAQDFVHPGRDTITQGVWSARSMGTMPSDITIDVTPSQAGQGSDWSLEFSSLQLNMPLAAQVYSDAQRAPFAMPNHPGLEVSGDGRGCNEIAGRFQVESLQLAGTTLKSFTATFEQHCEAGTSALRGCVHFEQ
jgi:hypothetical protein